MNMPYLDHTGSGCDSKKTGDPNRLAGIEIDNRKETRVIAETGSIKPDLKIRKAGKWPIGQISPVVQIEIATKRLEQVYRVVITVYRLQRAPLTLHSRPPRMLASLPVLHGETNRLVY